MKSIQTILIAGSLMLLAGCASVLSGTEQAITVNSEPEGATVYIDGVEKGVTPIVVKLPKNAHSTIMFKKDGYNSEIVNLTKQFDGVAILSVFWDLSTTDALTGAIYQYEPNRFFVTMKKKASS